MLDTDLMPFGAHKGKALANVPDSYLIWLYNQGISQKYKDLINYIEDNFNVKAK